MRVLVVRQAFGDYAVGDIIRDAAVIDAVKEAQQDHFCTPTDIDESFFTDEVAPAPAPTPKAKPAADAAGDA